MKLSDKLLGILDKEGYISKSDALTSTLYDSGKNGSRLYLTISDRYCCVTTMFCSSKAGAKTSYFAKFCTICHLVVYDTKPTTISQEKHCEE